jgi:predicted metalloprotease with PDZ domain
MKTAHSVRQVRACVTAVLLWSGTTAFPQTAPITLDVDATEAAQKILHARLVVPARPGPLTLVYPKWIPGEHGPTGPITDLVGLKMTSGGRPAVWQRDPDDLYAFHVEVPAGATGLEVALDFLMPAGSGDFTGGSSATAQLLDLNWNQVLLYPRDAAMAALQYAVTLRLPGGWKFATALPLAGNSPDGLRFTPVSLETLVDSPLIAGAHFRTIDLSPGATPAHALHIVSDSDTALDVKPEDAAHFTQLVAETGALFGARHYRRYDFLLTVSDHVAHFGLEHHESSDDRLGEKYLTDDDARKLGAILLPHEMVHSWNGKYRRPAALATPDFQKPMGTELLWVYEGLTDYLGLVLAARCGLWTNDVFREQLALTAATLDCQKGRAWRPLADTTRAAQLLYTARREGAGWRRSVDFYHEGDLIWLEADVVVRQQTRGRRSLDDFCRSFFGGESGPPKVISYTLDDLVAALNQVAAFDWRDFFQKRVYAINPRAPLGGIEGSGWRLAYTNTPNSFLKSVEGAHKFTDLSFSIGLVLREDGGILDVIPDSPADRAGLGPAMKLTAVNGRRWTADLLRSAVSAARTNAAPIELLVENDDFFRSCKVEYHEGEKYPCLERDESKPDLLSQILKPLTPVSASTKKSPPGGN